MRLIYAAVALLPTALLALDAASLYAQMAMTIVGLMLFRLLYLLQSVAYRVAKLETLPDQSQTLHIVRNLLAHHAIHT